MPAQRKGNRFVNPVPTRVGGISTIFKVGPRFFTGTAARSPQKPLGPFQTDHAIYRESPKSGLRVTWFGHSSSLVELDGARILIDPVWDLRAAPTQWAGPKRFFPPTLALEDLPPIDAVLISHDHYDHLGEGTVRRLALMQSAGVECLRCARWITPLGVGAILAAFGVDRSLVTELDWMGQARAGDVTITALPTRHFSGRGLFDRFQTLWASFALIGPRHRIYYGADSGEWDGFSELAKPLGRLT